MDRRRKLLVNQGEEISHHYVAIASAYNGAKVYPKIGLKDALNILQSGLSNEEYKYALMAHFDFVVALPGEKMSFAVEFDEAHHVNKEEQAKKDFLKNRICEKLGMPLLRIGKQSFQRINDTVLLVWLCDSYFNKKLNPFYKSYLSIQSYVKEGICHKGQDIPECITYVCTQVYSHSFAWVVMCDGQILVAHARFRWFGIFGDVYSYNLSEGLAVHSLVEKIENYLIRKYTPTKEDSVNFVAEYVAALYHQDNKKLDGLFSEVRDYYT